MAKYNTINAMLSIKIVVLIYIYRYRFMKE